MPAATLHATNDSPTADLPRQVGVLGHLARSTREHAREHGVVVAAQELFRIESLLGAVRAHQLETPLEVRGAAYGASLMVIELMIQREALSRPRSSTPLRSGSGGIPTPAPDRAA